MWRSIKIKSRARSPVDPAATLGSPGVPRGTLRIIDTPTTTMTQQPVLLAGLCMVCEERMHFLRACLDKPIPNSALHFRSAHGLYLSRYHLPVPPTLPPVHLVCPQQLKLGQTLLYATLGKRKEKRKKKENKKNKKRIKREREEKKRNHTTPVPIPTSVPG